MALEAFRIYPTNIGFDLPATESITAVELWENCVYLGTKGGAVYQYYYDANASYILEPTNTSTSPSASPTASNNHGYECYQTMCRQVINSKRPIQSIKAVPELDHLIIQLDNKLHFHDLRTLKKLTSKYEIPNVQQYCYDHKTHQICLHVKGKKKLWIYTYNHTKENYDYIRELALPDLPSSMTFVNGRICLGVGTNYILMSPTNGSTYPLSFNINHPPLMTTISNQTKEGIKMVAHSPKNEATPIKKTDGKGNTIAVDYSDDDPYEEVCLFTGEVGIYIKHTGDPSHRPPVVLSSQPQTICNVNQYILSISDDVLEVVSTRDSRIIQCPSLDIICTLYPQFTLPIAVPTTAATAGERDPRVPLIATHNENIVVYLPVQRFILILHTVPIELQIKQYLKKLMVDESLVLFHKYCKPTAYQINEFHIKIGLEYLSSLSFDNAFKYFTLSNVPPSQLLFSLFSHIMMLPQGTNSADIISYYKTLHSIYPNNPQLNNNITQIDGHLQITSDTHKQHIISPVRIDYPLLNDTNILLLLEHGYTTYILPSRKLEDFQELDGFTPSQSELDSNPAKIPLSLSYTAIYSLVLWFLMLYLHHQKTLFQQKLTKHKQSITTYYQTNKSALNSSNIHSLIGSSSSRNIQQQQKMLTFFDESLLNSPHTVHEEGSDGSDNEDSCMSPHTNPKDPFSSILSPHKLLQIKQEITYINNALLYLTLYFTSFSHPLLSLQYYHHTESSLEKNNDEMIKKCSNSINLPLTNLISYFYPYISKDNYSNEQWFDKMSTYYQLTSEVFSYNSQTYHNLQQPQSAGSSVMTLPFSPQQPVPEPPAPPLSFPLYLAQQALSLIPKKTKNVLTFQIYTITGGATDPTEPNENRRRSVISPEDGKTDLEKASPASQLHFDDYFLQPAICTVNGLKHIKLQAFPLSSRYRPGRQATETTPINTTTVLSPAPSESNTPSSVVAPVISPQASVASTPAQNTPLSDPITATSPSTSVPAHNPTLLNNLTTKKYLSYLPFSITSLLSASHNTPIYFIILLIAFEQWYALSFYYLQSHILTAQLLLNEKNTSTIKLNDIYQRILNQIMSVNNYKLYDSGSGNSSTTPFTEKQSVSRTQQLTNTMNRDASATSPVSTGEGNVTVALNKIKYDLSIDHPTYIYYISQDSPLLLAIHVYYRLSVPFTYQQKQKYKYFGAMIDDLHGFDVPNPAPFSSECLSYDNFIALDDKLIKTTIDIFEYEDDLNNIPNYYLLYKANTASANNPSPIGFMSYLLNSKSKRFTSKAAKKHSNLYYTARDGDDYDSGLESGSDDDYDDGDDNTMHYKDQHLDAEHELIDDINLLSPASGTGSKNRTKKRKPQVIVDVNIPYNIEDADDDQHVSITSPTMLPKDLIIFDYYPTNQECDGESNSNGETNTSLLYHNVLNGTKTDSKSEKSKKKMSALKKTVQFLGNPLKHSSNFFKSQYKPAQKPTKYRSATLNRNAANYLSLNKAMMERDYGIHHANGQHEDDDGCIIDGIDENFDKFINLSNITTLNNTDLYNTIYNVIQPDYFNISLAFDTYLLQQHYDMELSPSNINNSVFVNNTIVSKNDRENHINYVYDYYYTSYINPVSLVFMVQLLENTNLWTLFYNIKQHFYVTPQKRQLTEADYTNINSISYHNNLSITDNMYHVNNITSRYTFLSQFPPLHIINHYLYHILSVSPTILLPLLSRYWLTAMVSYYNSNDTPLSIVDNSVAVSPSVLHISSSGSQSTLTSSTSSTSSQLIIDPVDNSTQSNTNRKVPRSQVVLEKKLVGTASPSQASSTTSSQSPAEEMRPAAISRCLDDNILSMVQHLAVVIINNDLIYRKNNHIHHNDNITQSFEHHEFVGPQIHSTCHNYITTNRFVSLFNSNEISPTNTKYHNNNNVLFHIDKVTPPYFILILSYLLHVMSLNAFMRNNAVQAPQSSTDTGSTVTTFYNYTIPQLFSFFFPDQISQRRIPKLPSFLITPPTETLDIYNFYSYNDTSNTPTPNNQLINILLLSLIKQLRYIEYYQLTLSTTYSNNNSTAQLQYINQYDNSIIYQNTTNSTDNVLVQKVEKNKLYHFIHNHALLNRLYIDYDDFNSLLLILMNSYVINIEDIVYCPHFYKKSYNTALSNASCFISIDLVLDMIRNMTNIITVDKTASNALIASNDTSNLLNSCCLPLESRLGHHIDVINLYLYQQNDIDGVLNYLRIVSKQDRQNTPDAPNNTASQEEHQSPLREKPQQQTNISPSINITTPVTSTLTVIDVTSSSPQSPQSLTGQKDDIIIIFLQILFSQQYYNYITQLRYQVVSDNNNNNNNNNTNNKSQQISEFSLIPLYSEIVEYIFLTHYQYFTSHVMKIIQLYPSFLPLSILTPFLKLALPLMDCTNRDYMIINNIMKKFYLSYKLHLYTLKKGFIILHEPTSAPSSQSIGITKSMNSNNARQQGPKQAVDQNNVCVLCNKMMLEGVVVASIPLNAIMWLIDTYPQLFFMMSQQNGTTSKTTQGSPNAPHPLERNGIVDVYNNNVLLHFHCTQKIQQYIELWKKDVVSAQYPVIDTMNFAALSQPK